MRVILVKRQGSEVEIQYLWLLTVSGLFFPPFLCQMDLPINAPIQRTRLPVAIGWCCRIFNARYIRKRPLMELRLHQPSVVLCAVSSRNLGVGISYHFCEKGLKWPVVAGTNNCGAVVTKSKYRLCFSTSRVI